ncbi:uncharacterized protein V2V93DRAFT_350694 [Kockiozyma suomiensis]|uniref:uncharacterized protein n=1 Tax=Kockiozyma suomiensis TaxID=1337062 RepID=UPI0033440047
MLSLLRDAVLDAAATESACLLPPEQVRSLHSDINSLTSRLSSFVHQQNLHSSTTAAETLLRKLSSPATETVSTIPSPLNTLEKEIYICQDDLLQKQRSLLSHYLALNQQAAEHYIFPLSSILAAPADELSGKSVPFDIEPLLTVDSSSADGSDTLDFSQLLNFDDRIALKKSEDSRLELQQSISELEKSLLEISAQKSHQHENLARDLERTQSELASAHQQTRTVSSGDSELNAQILQLQQQLSSNENFSRRALLESELRQNLEDTQTEVDRLLELNAQKDQQIARLRAATASSVPIAAADKAKQTLAEENQQLKSKISKLQNDYSNLSEEHAAEFETILMQNAALNERLADMEARRTEKSISSSTSAALPDTTAPSSSPRKASRTIPLGAQTDSSLHAELRQVKASYESLLQQSLEFEGERASLERELDAVREHNLELESRMADSRVKVLATHASGNGIASNIINTPTESASVAVLRKEFRKMVTEMKTNHAQSMKAEAEERRRLEKVIRDLRRLA